MEEGRSLSSSLTSSSFHRRVLLTFVFFYFLSSVMIVTVTGENDHDGSGGSSSSEDGTRLKDPYVTLGVGRRASATEIRRAYKQLVKEWHPDKNKDPSAQNKFVQINRAYELLIDPDRRRLFDQRGITEESPNSTPRHDYSAFNQFDPVDEILTFTTGGSFNFPFADGIASLHKQSVTSKTFDQTILPKSNTIPQLILFYGDWCTGCARAAPAWRTITDDLQGIGMDVLTIHAERERTVSRRMGISAVPAILLLIESQPHHYRDSVITASKVVAFVRSKLPSDVMQHIDSSNVDNFLSSWSDNRVRVLIFGTGTNVRLRYMLLAFQFLERAAFGYVYPSDYALRSRFGAQKAIDTIMVFKELSKPVASLSMSDIPSNLMKDLVENNKFLILPRLSSQPIMDTICPTESSVYRRRLCVLLLTQDRASEIEQRDKLRDFSMKHVQTRVRFGYVYKDKQEEFFNSLVNGGLRTSSQNLVIVWRQDRKRISYEWIDWDGSNASCQHLEATLHKLLNEKQALAYQIEIKELTDEHAKSLMSKVFKKISLTMDFVRGHLTRELVIQTTSLVATILFIVAAGFIMTYLVRLEEESIAAKAAGAANTRERSQTHARSTTRSTNPSSSTRTQAHSNGTSGSAYPDLRVHEMRGETYNGLVRLIKPGCRTIVLLLDSDTKNSLLPKFQRCVYPYRKNKSLQFAFMHVDKGGGLRWYKQLLQLSLAEPRNLNINPRNCVGTVLSLNGFRRYFCVFHVTLPGGTAKRHRSAGYRNGGFLGFDSDKSSGDDNSDIESRRQDPPPPEHRPSVLFTSHLLDNLSNWLDRLFEGTTHRYHISDDWPEFAII